MLNTAIPIAFVMIGLAMMLSLYRMVIGPDMTDRVLALDTLYINTVALIVLIGIDMNNSAYFESALLIAIMGFVGTVALSKYMLRGNIIE
ncbi:MAG: K+/H+ antiporter subunit F [Methylotenera sp.]|jgi:multicomponent K+:H+ antiporter subunit F|uniref:K+/H+ antiporter subunit F n=1 Tax=Methylotenera sp. TaxID=2051956 RepID=UPI000D455BD3|nr:K+/H+ antiporter subunit F [Methylotenera sp.]MDP3211084.1 K+/H+ antiporter subunit F [Methylotenera sp.]MDP3778089.1 K+/H+ antiporter subunit F [Methylotenera sp.]PPC96497.1 MAG: K+/H+ antiporter subunit F [Methylotenera sp.]